MVDGSDNNDISVTISTSQIVPEAVAEFQVLQNPYSVEFGRNSGGQINVITKSGTNRFRGDFLDYYQSSGLNSRTNIEKANNLADARRAHSPSARRRPRRPDVPRQGCSSSASISATRSVPPNGPSPTTVPHSDAGRLCGAAERAAGRRADGVEPAGGARADRRSSRTSTRTNPMFRNVSIDTGQRRADRDRADQRQHRRSEHVSHGPGPRGLPRRSRTTTSRSAIR